MILDRTLSYKGAEFQIAKVQMDPVFRVMYNRSANFWHLLHNIMSTMPARPKKVISQYFSAQQRFYRQMLMAAKVSEQTILLCSASISPQKAAKTLCSPQ